ncbi:MAG TPA: hypothetical protein VGM25_00775 [Caulobacteraceae bacterium]|jgi:hypothetical protein
MADARIALGFRAQRGGAVVVGVSVEDGAPRMILSTVLATAAEGDRLAFEPYHVAFEMTAGARGVVPAEAEAAVAEGRRRQLALAVEGVKAMTDRLREAGPPPAAALLVNRAGWMTDLLRYSLFDPAHPPVAEGLAVREALRLAARRCGLDLVEMDEKSLPEAGAIALGLSPAELEGRLKALGAGGKPWRKEQKLACLAAWLAAAAVVPPQPGNWDNQGL